MAAAALRASSTGSRVPQIPALTHASRSASAASIARPRAIIAANDSGFYSAEDPTSFSTSSLSRITWSPGLARSYSASASGPVLNYCFPFALHSLSNPHILCSF